MDDLQCIRAACGANVCLQPKTPPKGHLSPNFLQGLRHPSLTSQMEAGSELGLLRWCGTENLHSISSHCWAHLGVQMDLLSAGGVPRSWGMGFGVLEPKCEYRSLKTLVPMINQKESLLIRYPTGIRSGLCVKEELSSHVKSRGHRRSWGVTMCSAVTAGAGILGWSRQGCWAVLGWRPDGT